MSASLDQIYQAILDLKGEVGGVRADVKNAHAFAASVSHKADIAALAIKLRANDIIDKERDELLDKLLQSMGY